MNDFDNGSMSAFSNGAQDAGFTKREYFAGLAMQGDIAKYGMDDDDESCVTVAKQAVRYADALLAALKEEPNEN